MESFEGFVIINHEDVELPMVYVEQDSTNEEEDEGEGEEMEESRDEREEEEGKEERTEERKEERKEAEGVAQPELQDASRTATTATGGQLTAQDKTALLSAAPSAFSPSPSSSSTSLLLSSTRRLSGSEGDGQALFPRIESPYLVKNTLHLERLHRVWEPQLQRTICE